MWGTPSSFQVLQTPLSLSLSLPPPPLELFALQVLLFIFVLSLFFLRKPKSTATSTASGFKVYPLFGTIPEFLRNRHRFLDWTTEVLSRHPTHTGVFRSPGQFPSVITANPLNVEHMLKTNFDNYPKGPRFTTVLRDFLGQGIFNSDADLWKVQRKTASYEFNSNSIRNFVMDNVTVEIQTRLVPSLEKAAQANRVLDIQDVFERFAFDNICKLAFNVDPACLGGNGTDGGEFMRAFEEAATLSSGRFLYALPFLCRIKRYLNIGSEYRLRKSINKVHEFADEIIKSRIEERAKNKDQDLLSRFMRTAELENSAEFLRDIVISFILAGRDTTSAALSWFFWLLSSKPHVQKNIRRELETIRFRNGKRPGDAYSFDELREMQYLHAAISEALRLYPPVPMDSKECREDDVMPDGTVLKKGWFVSYHTYAMARMESIWGSDCCEFKPERWLENGVCRAESPFRFPVFHAGPRICLGKDMAYIQMKSIAASVMERFEIDVQNKDTCPQHLLSLTLRMKGGLPVRVGERRR